MNSVKKNSRSSRGPVDILFSKLRSGTARTLGSYLVGFGTQGLYFFLLARALGVEDFGIWAGALGLTTVFGGLVGLGAGNVLVVRVSKSRSLLGVQLGAALIYIIASALPLGALAWVIGSSTSTVFAQVLVALLVSELIAVRIFDVALQVFQSQDDLGRNSLCRIFGSALRLIAVVLFFLFGSHTVESWSYWYAWTTGLSAALSLLWVVQRFGLPRIHVNTLKDTWRTGIFFAVGISSRTLYLEADKFILNKLGLSEAAGSLSASGRLITMAFAPIQALVYSSNTSFFRAGAVGPKELWKSMKRPLIYTVVYGLAAGGLICLFAPLASVVLGPSYEAVPRFLIWLSPLVLLNGLHYLLGDALMGLGRQGLRSMAQFIVALLSVFGNILLIPTYGVSASVIVTISCSFLLAALMALIFWRTLKDAST